MWLAEGRSFNTESNVTNTIAHWATFQKALFYSFKLYACTCDVGGSYVQMNAMLMED